jgi:hypothetical protein
MREATNNGHQSKVASTIRKCQLEEGLKVLGWIFDGSWGRAS